ncbi:uncharacterized protein rps6kl1 isoform X2 [Scleropages formosus]|uniref:uncharacterized protein rps6kl1 isoform X2 n=1 Tax=Scleropages formosus TaxID=113540 RepID=UPI0010FA749F|nr:ribosomal protein S6 kinase-like 1 isoform X2 [Scleropages formosus]
MAKRDYLVDAAKQIRMALDREVSEDYEAAFNYYKNGVDLLLNGIQVDPNKERREAVKRKTTQYLKRAEEIFNSHLQGSLGIGTTLSGGYSSLRFRPIRNLSMPVEDLKTCKVVGVVDKVLAVQSLTAEETFIVKSLPKSSGESREQPTIIPQGVPFMVKLLRYYVSEDAVYLHLGYVQGGRLFSKLRKLRNEKLKEHPECCSPANCKIHLRNSYTTPAMSLDDQQSSKTVVWLASEGSAHQDPEPGDTESLASWEEVQRQLESCRTHSYCEETGCLYSARAGHSDDPPEPNRASGPPERDAALGAGSAHITVQRLSHTQVTCTVPPHGRFTGGLDEAPSRTWDPLKKHVQTIESSPDFHVNDTSCFKSPNPSDTRAWNDVGREVAGAYGIPHVAKSSAAAPWVLQPSKGEPTSPVDAKSQGIDTPTLELDVRKQIQGRRGAAAETARSPEGPRLVCDPNRNPVHATGVLSSHGSPGSGSTCRPTAAETKKTVEAIRTDALSCVEEAVPAVQTANTFSGNTQPSSGSHSRGTDIPTSVSLDTPEPKDLGERHRGEEADDGWELLSPLKRDAAEARSTGGQPWDPHPTPPAAAHMSSRKAEPDGLEAEQPIEVDGWCLLPRIPARRPKEKSEQGCRGLPEAEVRLWGAHIVLALESLHQQGILCRDLNPKNILLDSNGNVCLTYFGQWSDVQLEISAKAMENMYCAPEIGGVAEITEACDWWSLGALLYELLSGMVNNTLLALGALPFRRHVILRSTFSSPPYSSDRRLPRSPSASATPPGSSPTPSCSSRIT